MIRLVACGIGNARDKEPIPCARQDAELIYNSFQSHFPDFDNCYSITLYNASAESFQRAIRNAAKDLNETDILAVYFSGHATSHAEGEVKLFFRDGADDIFSSERLWDGIENLGCNKLLILDCCYAGGAISLANYRHPEHKKFFVLTAVGSCSMAEHSTSVSPFTQALINCLDELDSTGQAITLTSIQQTLEKNNYLKSELGIAVGEIDLSLKAAVSTAGSAEFITAFWNKLPVLPSSTRAIMWYALDSSNLSYDTKIKIIEQLYIGRPHFYEGSWIVRRAIGHMLGELPQQDLQVKKAETKLLDSKSWIDMCIGLVATRNQNTSHMQKIRRDICRRPGLPMDVVWLANLYYADYFTENRADGPGDEIFLPQQLCETTWGVEDLSARYRGQEAVLDHLKTMIGNSSHNILHAQKMILNSDTFSTSNLLLSTYLKCPKRGRNTASYRDKWLRSILFGQWRDHPLADSELEVYFQNTSLEDCQKDLKNLSSATIDIKLGILNYVSSLSHDERKKYQEALSWALGDPHPWVRRDSFMIFNDDLERIKETAFSDIINRDQYPGVLDMIIEANTISKRPDWNAFLKEYSKKNEFSEAEINAIKNYLE